MNTKFRSWCFATGRICLTVIFTAFLLLLREYSLGVPVLNYHQITDAYENELTVTTEEFDRQMAHLYEHGYHTITPDQLTDYLTNGTPLPEKPILITFDDGYRDNYENAYPILKKYNMKATIFLVSDFMNHWDNYLTSPQIIEMNEFGGIYMGSHTLSHFELTPLSPDALHLQLEGGKLATEWITRQLAEYIAYPCGSYNEQVLKEVAATGYKGGFTVRFDLVHPGDNVYAMNRIPIFGNRNHSYERFLLRLYGAPVWGRLERLRAHLIAEDHPTIARAIWLP